MCLLSLQLKTKSTVKYCLIFISLLITNFTKAQDALEFIEAYNKHIDPMNKLEQINKVDFRMFSSIKLTLGFNNINQNIESERDCSYYTNNTWNCNYGNNLIQSFSESLLIPEEDGGNALKIHLNMIATHPSKTFRFLQQTDSITVVEVCNETNTKHHYTFKSQTKDLLEIKRINNKDGIVNESVTTFLRFITIDKIILPKRVEIPRKVTTFFRGKLTTKS
jgi:hypothetical protein